MEYLEPFLRKVFCKIYFNYHIITFVTDNNKKATFHSIVLLHTGAKHIVKCYLVNNYN